MLPADGLAGYVADLRFTLQSSCITQSCITVLSVEVRSFLLGAERVHGFSIFGFYSQRSSSMEILVRRLVVRQLRNLSSLLPRICRHLTILVLYAQLA